MIGTSPSAGRVAMLAGASRAALLLPVIVGTLCLGDAAYAQTAAPPVITDASAPVAPTPAPDTAATAPVDSTDAAPADIVVTAQKREERLQNVGLTVAAFGARTLENERVRSVADLAKVVPGLDVTPSFSGTPVYTLRGVGFYEASVGAMPDVAVYLDQAPLALPVFSALTAFDLERVEVLKGPQGTLFGTNATGGAINLIAAKPTAQPHAGMELTYARFNTVQLDAFVSGPLTDTLRARLAVRFDHGDDWQRSYTRPGDTLGKVDDFAARLLFEWEPTDRFSANLNINGWYNKSDPQAPQLARTSTPADLQVPLGTTGFKGTLTDALPLLHVPPAPADARAANWDPDYRPYRNDHLAQATLTMAYELFEDVTLTSLTGYVDFRQDKASARSGLPVDDADEVSDRARASDVSQEVRLANSGANQRFRWVVGGNYERTFDYEVIDLAYSQASTGAQQGFTRNSFDSRQTVTQLAAFGHVEYDLTAKLSIKGGIRYSHSVHPDESRTFQPVGFTEPDPRDIGVTNFVNVVFPAVVVPLFCPGTVFRPVTQGESVSFNPVTCQSGTYRYDLRENNVPWSVGVDYKPVRDVLLYADVSRGYKAGGFAISNASSQAQYAPVRQEGLTDYEIGFKSTLLGGKVLFNGAAFYYDYSAKQLRGKTVDPLFGQLDQLISIPKSIIKGGELDLTATPAHGLTLRLSGTYLDSEITRYDGVVGVTIVNGLSFPVLASFHGVPLPFTPKLSGTASIDYDFPAGDRLNLFVGASGRGQTQSYGTPQVTAQGRADARINGYAILDLRAGVRGPRDRWRLTAWGRNVTNRYYWTDSLRNFDTIVRYAGRPAEYGVSLALHW